MWPSGPKMYQHSFIKQLIPTPQKYRPAHACNRCFHCTLVHHEDCLRTIFRCYLLSTVHSANVIQSLFISWWPDPAKKVKKCFSLRVEVALQIRTGLAVKWCGFWNTYPCQQKCFVRIVLYWKKCAFLSLCLEKPFILLQSLVPLKLLPQKKQFAPEGSLQQWRTITAKHLAICILVTSAECSDVKHKQMFLLGLSRCRYTGKSGKGMNLCFCSPVCEYCIEEHVAAPLYSFHALFLWWKRCTKCWWFVFVTLIWYSTASVVLYIEHTRPTSKTGCQRALVYVFLGLLISQNHRITEW